MRIVMSGWWLYDGTGKVPVDIVGLPYDFWYELGELEDTLEPGETPAPFGAEGLLYYARFREAGQTLWRTWPDSAGYPTIDEAVHAAEQRAPTQIHWTPGENSQNAELA